MARKDLPVIGLITLRPANDNRPEPPPARVAPNDAAVDRIMAKVA